MRTDSLEAMRYLIRAATETDVPAAAATLAAAFDTYPWTRWTVPADGYTTRLTRLQELYLTHAVHHGLVLVGEDLAGVAAFLPPDCPEPDEALQREIADLLGDRVSAAFGTGAPAPPENSWHLATLGVAPARTGRGLGTAMLEEGLGRIASSPSPRVSLETSDIRNVALYERFGFVISHVTEINGGPVVYSMLREAPLGEPAG